MSMVFAFADIKKAREFAAAVKQRYGLDGQVFDDADEAHEHDYFPWVQVPPIVHIDRASLETETEVERLVNQYGGTFLGT